MRRRTKRSDGDHGDQSRQSDKRRPGPVSTGRGLRPHQIGSNLVAAAHARRPEPRSPHAQVLRNPVAADRRVNRASEPSASKTASFSDTRVIVPF